MTKIVVGTTPTITYRFKIVSVSDIMVAILTIKDRSGIILEKTLADASIGEDSLSWKLTQEETLAMGTRPYTMMLNWKTADGTRGASDEVSISTAPNHIKEVI